MSPLLLTLLLLGLTSFGFVLGKRRALALVGHPRQLNSLPGYYGSYVALWCLIPTALVLGLWLALEPMVLESRVKTLISGTSSSVFIRGALLK